MHSMHLSSDEKPETTTAGNQPQAFSSVRAKCEAPLVQPPPPNDNGERNRAKAPPSVPVNVMGPVWHRPPAPAQVETGVVGHQGVNPSQGNLEASRHKHTRAKWKLKSHNLCNRLLVRHNQ